jgi:hypothetical protein
MQSEAIAEKMNRRNTEEFHPDHYLSNDIQFAPQGVTTTWPQIPGAVPAALQRLQAIVGTGQRKSVLVCSTRYRQGARDIKRYRRNVRGGVRL